jgi:hypothetical protein
MISCLPQPAWYMEPYPLSHPAGGVKEPSQGTGRVMSAVISVAESARL